MKEEAKKKPKKVKKPNDEVVKAWDKAQDSMINWFEGVIGDIQLLDELKAIRAQTNKLLP